MLVSQFLESSELTTSWVTSHRSHHQSHLNILQHYYQTYKKQWWTLSYVVAIRKEDWDFLVFECMSNLSVSQNSHEMHTTSWSGNKLQGNAQLKNAIKFVWRTPWSKLSVSFLTKNRFTQLANCDHYKH